jgi:putative nucleotidyltransferase with HDIG domain
MITTGLIIAAMNLDSGISPKQIWNEKFSWLAPYYISMGLIAYALIFGFQKAGVIGLFVILVPLLILRLSQKQYIDRTTANVNELRDKNALLENSAQEITKLNEGLLTALSDVIDLRNPFVLGHSQHVTRYSILIAERLGLQPKRIELIHKAGLLHDIGKLGIPDSILLKPGPLTSQEYNTIKMHTTLGAEILEKSHSLRDLVPVIRHHHERFDGTGYPGGLHESQIPLEARIISVADAIEAMASDRPYRKALSFKEILEELRDHAGTQFDPLIVEAVLEVFQSKGESLLLNSARKIMVQQLPPVDPISEAHMYLKFKEMAKKNHR